MFNLFNRWKASHRGEATAGSGNARIRSFAAAEQSRILAPWTFDGGFSNGEVASALALIRARSRDMAKNSEQYLRWLDAFVANVVGTGFTFKAMPLGFDGVDSIDDEAARFLQYHFWKWSHTARFVDITGRKTFSRFCRLMAENWARDGEAIAILYRTSANPYGFTLRAVRPDALDETLNNYHTSGNTVIRNGVEVDLATLQPIAYYFRAGKEDPQVTRIGSRTLIRIPAERVVHIFTQHDEAQTRGIPLGHAVLKKLKMLDLYNEAELAAARDEANTVGIFYTDKGEEGEVAKLNEDDETTALLCQRSDVAQKYVLPNTWKYDSKTPQHPNREVSAFKNSMLRDVASGLGIEYACFANDWAGVSFSSVRAGTLAERDHWKILQDDFAEMFLAPVYRAWLNAFLATRLANPYVPSEYERLAEFEFRGRTWAWVDPMKDINSAAIAVEHGWKTDEQVAAEFGTDFDENLAEAKRVKPLKEAAGLLTKAQKVEPDNTGKEKDDDEKGDK